MVGLSSPGVGSGLDVKSIVDALVQAEISPAKNRLDREEASLSTKLSSLGQIKSALAKLQNTMTKLSNLNQFSSFSPSVSNPSLLQASINGSNLSPASYQIQIQQLANSQSLASEPFANSTASVGQGTLTIEFGTYASDNSSFTLNSDINALTLTIAEDQDSLAAIRDAINNLNGGVTAAIVQDNAGTRLTLLSKETGLNSSMRISVSDNDGNNSDNSGLSALAFDPSSNINNLIETAAAKDSQVYINGLLINQSSNQLSNTLDGLSLNLLKASPGEIINLSLTKNKEQTTASVNEFIKQYNDTLNTINSLTAYNKDSKTAGSLQSDAGIRALKFKLANLIVSPIQSLEGPFKSLADIGIKTNNQGMLTLNSETFNKALNENFDAIATLFAKSTTDSDPGKTVEGIAVSFQNLISPYLDGGGELTTRTNQLNQNLKNIDKSRDDLSLRTSSLIERYTKQFTALDTLLIQMQGTSQFLTQQLANLPQINSKRT